MPKAKSKGKEAGAPKRQGPKSNHRGGFAAGNKQRNRQRQVMLREKKVRHVLQTQRLGSGYHPPRIVGILGGNESSNPEALHQAIGRHCEFEANSKFPTTIGTLSKHRFTFVVDATMTEQRIVDIAKVTDILLFSLDCSPQAQEAMLEAVEQQKQQQQQARYERAARAQDGGDDDDDEDDAAGTTRTYFDNIGLCITPYTRNLVRMINAQGCPTVVVSLQGLDECDPVMRRNVHRLHERYFKSVFSEETAVVIEDMPTLLRTLEMIKVRRLAWRDQHPYFVAEEGEYDDETRVCKLSGYLRGANLAADMLIHITNHGTFQIAKITADGDPCSIGEDDATGELDVADENSREPLERWRVNETAYNDEQDLRGFEAAAVAEPTTKVKVPEGTSEYQAAWYSEALVNEGEGDDDDHPRSEMPDDARSHAFTHQTDIDDLRLSDVVGSDDKTLAQKFEELERIREESRDELRHPDEKDTPLHMPARQRFAKYRGMKSFARGKWDPEENLPLDYARIFTLRGYGKIRDEAVAETQGNPVQVGTYVTVHIENVSPEMWANADDVLIVSGQLRHEQKWSLLHCHLQRDSDHTDSIKSKTPMMIHVGFRKFFSQPIYSDVATGDRTRYSRYFHAEDKFRLGSFYGPISYHPCPVLFFNVPDSEEEGGVSEVLNQPRFFAFGSVVPPNPNFIILKRIVLTGRIAVIYKKQVVVKYMFYNDEDVRWYQPLDLYTRLGRRGKILKPLGEHGLYKAQFSDTVMQHDVVCLDLYKRVFPKWKTVEYNVTELLGGGGDDDAEEGEVADD